MSGGKYPPHKNGNPIICIAVLYWMIEAIFGEQRSINAGEVNADEGVNQSTRKDDLNNGLLLLSYFWSAVVALLLSL